MRLNAVSHHLTGVDVYFDNVGGDILNTVLRRINKGILLVFV